MNALWCSWCRLRRGRGVESASAGRSLLVGPAAAAPLHFGRPACASDCAPLVTSVHQKAPSGKKLPLWASMQPHPLSRAPNCWARRLQAILAFRPHAVAARQPCRGPGRGVQGRQRQQNTDARDSAPGGRRGLGGCPGIGAHLRCLRLLQPDQASREGAGPRRLPRQPRRSVGVAPIALGQHCRVSGNGRRAPRQALGGRRRRRLSSSPSRRRLRNPTVCRYLALAAAELTVDAIYRVVSMCWLV